MISTAKKPTLAKQRKAMETAVRRLREEAEDLLESIDLLEARARNFGKPTSSLAEIKKKLGLK